MFEAVVTLCLDLAAGPCRETLLPGYEAASIEACLDALAESPPQLAGAVPKGQPTCSAAADGLAVAEVAPGVFVHRGRIAEPDMQNRGDVANAGFIIGTRSVAVIDTGSARWLGEDLWRSIRARTDLPVSHVVLTHLHPDHAFGAAVFAEAGAQVVAHAELPRALADRYANYAESFGRLIGDAAFLGTAQVAVDVEVSGTLEIDLGNRRLTLQAWPRAHTGTDVTVLDISTGTLFAGDLVFDEHVPALDGSVIGWQAVLDALVAMPADRVVPGHGGPVLDWPEGAAATRQYLATVEADTRAALADGLRLGEAAQSIAAGEAEKWHLFEAYNARNAIQAFTELEWE
jgi:quinoprotein relay system zinc metallohydrolase 2